MLQTKLEYIILIVCPIVTQKRLNFRLYLHCLPLSFKI